MAGEVHHSGDEHFILNMHSLHNASLIRKILPRSLTAIRPLINPASRVQEHAALANRLRETNTQKRNERKEKRRLQAEKKNKEKEKVAEEADLDTEDEQSDDPEDLIDSEDELY
jgi:hypothetical protein